MSVDTFPEKSRIILPSYLKYKLTNTDLVSGSEVEEIKKYLNKEKSALDPYFAKYEKEYGKFTNMTAPSEIKKQVEKCVKQDNGISIVTNAWLKCYEMLAEFKESGMLQDMLEQDEILHFGNAELPGNFILASLYFFKNKENMKYDYIASSYLGGDGTLNDMYGIMERNPNKWLMHRYGIPGDLTDPFQVEILCKDYINKVDFYTADGGLPMTVDTFNDQENVVHKLKVGEMISGYLTLKPHTGIMLVKYYTYFSPTTLKFLIKFMSLFDESYVIKPMTSRPANSEVYFVFKGKKSDKLENLNSWFTATSKSHSKVPRSIVDSMYQIFGKQMYFIRRNYIMFEQYIKEKNKTPSLTPQQYLLNINYLALVNKARRALLHKYVSLTSLECDNH